MVRVNKDYIVDVDAYSYTSKEDLHKVDKNGVPLYKIIGYYNSLPGAITGIFNYKAKKILAEEEMPLYEAVRKLEAIKTELIDALKQCQVGDDNA